MARLPFVTSSLFLRGLVLLFWMGVIFFFSSLAGSPDAPEPTLSYYLERKSAHVIEYVVLVILAVRFFFAIFPRETFLRILFLATSFSITYGVSDELHQFFVPYRGARMSDALIDSGGVLLVVIIYYLVYRKRYSG
jgi:VanZ family protein